MENLLPVGWAWTTFSEVCETTSGGTPDRKNKSYYGGSIAWVKSGELSYDIIEETEETITEEAVKNSSAKIFPKGTLLIALYGTTTGKLAFLGIEAATNQAIAAVFPSIGINKMYVYYYLLFYRDELLLKRIGGAQPNISQTILNKIPFPLAPLSEQTRIVAALDEYMAHLRTAETALDEIPSLLRQFRQKVLAMAVSGELTVGFRENTEGVETAIDLLKRKQKELLEKNLKGSLIDIETFNTSKISENWVELTLKNLFLKGNLFDGPFGSHLKSIDYKEEGVRVIRLENIGFMEFFEEKETFVSYEKYESLIKHEVFEGDIIFSSFISEKIRATILPELPIKAIAKSDCFCLRPMQDLVNKEFLLFLLSSQQIFDILTGNIHGSTRPRINTTQLKELVINLPPFAEQTEIVRRVEELLNIATEIETAYDTARAELKVLPQVLLSKAFKGELLTPSVSAGLESVATLLERIKAEKARLVIEKKAGKDGKGFRKTKGM